MMVETTSLILNLCLKYPTRAPTRAPITKPITTTSGFATAAGRTEYPIRIVAVNPAASICPDTPILKRPAFRAIITERAANSMGVRALRKLAKSVMIPL